MNMKSIWLRVSILVVTIMVIGGIFFWRSGYFQNYLANRQRIKDVEARMLATNPEILNNIREANKTLGYELKKTPDDPELWFEIGANKKNLGDYIGAEKALKKSMEINKIGINAPDTLGIIYQELGRYSEAEDMFRQMTERQPIYQEGYIRLAELYETGKYKTIEEAEKILLAGINLDVPDNPAKKPLLFALTEYYDQIGDKIKSQETWSELNKLGVKNQEPKTPTLLMP